MAQHKGSQTLGRVILSRSHSRPPILQVPDCRSNLVLIFRKHHINIHHIKGPWTWVCHCVVVLWRYYDEIGSIPCPNLCHPRVATRNMILRSALFSSLATPACVVWSSTVYSPEAWINVKMHNVNLKKTTLKISNVRFCIIGGLYCTCQANTKHHKGTVKTGGRGKGVDLESEEPRRKSNWVDTKQNTIEESKKPGQTEKLGEFKWFEDDERNSAAEQKATTSCSWDSQ